MDPSYEDKRDYGRVLEAGEIRLDASGPEFLVRYYNNAYPVDPRSQGGLLREAASQAAQVEQGLTQAKTADATASAEKKKLDAEMLQASADVTIQEILSRVEANLANAKSAEDRTQLENLKTLLASAVEGGKNEPRTRS